MLDAGGAAAKPAQCGNPAIVVNQHQRFRLAIDTGPAPALLMGEAMLAAMPARACRMVIDVAGDGHSNDSPPPAPIRDRLNAAGVTINGLCVLHEEPDLLANYTREVVGGLNAFALVCRDYNGVAEAMRRKFQQEVA